MKTAMEKMVARESRWPCGAFRSTGTEGVGSWKVETTRRVKAELAAELDRPVLRGLREIGYRLVEWQRELISRWFSG
jgi:hypothetical protein